MDTTPAAQPLETVTEPQEVPHGCIIGTVTAPDGKALVGAEVSIASGPGTGGTVTTGANGAFSLEDLPVGPEYTLVAQKAGFTRGESHGVLVEEGRAVSVAFTLRHEDLASAAPLTVLRRTPARIPGLGLSHRR